MFITINKFIYKPAISVILKTVFVAEDTVTIEA